MDNILTKDVCYLLGNSKRTVLTRCQDTKHNAYITPSGFLVHMIILSYRWGKFRQKAGHIVNKRRVQHESRVI